MGGALLFAAVVLWLYSGLTMRMLSAAAILVFAVCSVAFMKGRGHRPVILSGTVVAALLMSPLEVSLINRPGPPGVVPLIMGLPGRELHERSRRGEVVLGGCITTGLEPRWVVVW